MNPADYSRSIMHVACAFLEGTGPFAEEQRVPGVALIDPRVRGEWRLWVLWPSFRTAATRGTLSIAEGSSSLSCSACITHSALHAPFFCSALPAGRVLHASPILLIC